jgi:hypothetical protein
VAAGLSLVPRRAGDLGSRQANFDIHILLYAVLGSLGNPIRVLVLFFSRAPIPGTTILENARS